MNTIEQRLKNLLDEREIEYDFHVHPAGKSRDWVLIVYHNDPKHDRIQVIRPSTCLDELWWLV